MNRGELGASTYYIPPSFIGGEQPQQNPVPSLENPINTPQPKDHLAHVEGLTDKYYDTDAKLEAYATSMAKDYGIDVTKPDPTQPGGGTPFKTYMKLASGLLYTANDLAASHDVNKILAQQQAAGNILTNPGFDQNAQPTSTMNPNQMFTSTNLDDQVKQANDFLQREVYTQRDADKVNAQVRQPLINYYQQRIQQDPGNAQYYQRQIAAIGTATPKTPYSAFQTNGGAGAKQPGIALLRKITNLSKGVWDEGTYTPIIKDGQVYLENHEMAGDSMGHDYDKKTGAPIYRPKITKSWLKDPETGKVFIQYADPNIPMDEVSTQPGSSVASTFISNNPKYGDASKMLETANRMGLLDEMGSSIDEYLLHPNQEQIRERVRNAGKAKSQIINNIRDTNAKKLNDLKDPAWWGSHNSIGFKLPDGREIEIKKHRGKQEFYVADPEDFFQSTEGTENMSAEQVMKTLSSLGYFNQFLKQSIPEGKSVSLQTIKSKVGTKGFEGYDEQELIDYYKSQGYTIK